MLLFTKMEHGHDTSGGATLATIFFSIMSFLFKGGIVDADKYLLNPMAHTVSIICGTCGIISFLFVLHPPLKDWLIRVVSGLIESVQVWFAFVKGVFKKK